MPVPQRTRPFPIVIAGGVAKPVPQADPAFSCTERDSHAGRMPLDGDPGIRKTPVPMPKPKGSAVSSLMFRNCGRSPSRRRAPLLPLRHPADCFRRFSASAASALPRSPRQNARPKRCGSGDLCPHPGQFFQLTPKRCDPGDLSFPAVPDRLRPFSGHGAIDLHPRIIRQKPRAPPHHAVQEKLLPFFTIRYIQARNGEVAKWP